MKGDTAIFPAMVPGQPPDYDDVRKAAYGAAKDVENLSDWMAGHEKREDKARDEMTSEIKGLRSDMNKMADKVGTQFDDMRKEVAKAIAGVSRISWMWAGGTVTILAIWAMLQFVIPLIWKA